MAPPDVEFNEMAEPPAATAARHAARYFDNVHPVSARLYGAFDLDCTPSQRVTPPPVFFFRPLRLPSEQLAPCVDTCGFNKY